MTPELVKATREGNFEKVRKLLNEGADVNARDSDGFSALYVASYCDNTKMSELLIMQGADVNITAIQQGGETPLMGTPYSGNNEIATLLLNNRAEINRQNRYGYTTLHKAVICFRYSTQPLKLIETLLERGADINIRNQYGNSPVELTNSWTAERRKKLKDLFNKLKNSTKVRP